MAIRGSLGVSSVADVLQLLALGRKSGRLLIYSPGRLVLVELEEGAIVHPVEGITIAGNLQSMFQAIEAVGSDVDPRSHLRTGSILLGNMTVAGSQ